MGRTINLSEKTITQIKPTLASLGKLTYDIFSRKEIGEQSASMLLKYLAFCHKHLKKEGKAEFLDRYFTAITALNRISNERHLKRIDATLTNRLENIERIYQETNDKQLYLDGQNKMFNVIFMHFNHASMGSLIVDESKKGISEALAA